MRLTASEHPDLKRRGIGLATTVAVITAELQRRGLDARPLLDAHGLDQATLNHPLGRFPRAAILDFVASANTLAGDPGLHVHASAAAEVGIFRLADYFCVMSPTVGIGFRAAMEAFGFVNDGVRFALRETPSSVMCELHAVHEPHPDPLEVACTFVVIEARLRTMTHDRFGIASLDVRAPEDEAGRAMRKVLSDTLFRFDQPLDRVVIERAAWETKPLLSHPAVAQIVRATMNAPIVSEVRDWFVAVEEAIRAGLAHGEVGAPVVASRLGTSERSLQRRLQERGTSFVALLERVRQSEAFRLLRARDPVGKIAARLGYSETSAFTRAFRRWTGQSPREWTKREPLQKVVD